jgi:hypothetical protein
MACYKTSYYCVTCYHFICHDHEINDSSYILTIKDLINMLKKAFPLKIKPTHACQQQNMKFIIQICVSNCLLLCDVKELIACVNILHVC